MCKIDKIEARKMLIKTYKETRSIRKVAKIWATSRSVVRKWLRRYQEAAEKGLENISHRPHFSPKKSLWT